MRLDIAACLQFIFSSCVMSAVALAEHRCACDMKESCVSYERPTLKLQKATASSWQAIYSSQHDVWDDFTYLQCGIVFFNYSMT